jgi:hypothetical protein
MDNELKGEGNSLNYEYRMHDPRVGRFFAPDPLEPKYPFYSPYQFSGNRVIDMVELEGLEPAEPGSKVGEKQSAFDQEAVKNNDYSFSDLFTGDKLYGDWFWHAGTANTKADWYKTNDYKAVVMPFAVDMAKFEGWSYGTDWKSAKDLICNPGSGGAMSERLKNFISSRVFDSTGGDALDMLTQIGASQINSANKALAGSASGAITPMEIDSPFFGLGLGYKAFFTEAKAVKFSSLAETGTIDPFQVRFSQSSIGANFKNGNSVFDITKISDDIPAIKIVEKDGLIYTLDNRRLKLFQEAGVPIKYEKLNAIPKKDLFKFTTKNKGKTIKVRG